MTQSEHSKNFLIQGTEAHKVAQAVYHAVTGKTEKLSRAYTKNYKITFEDVQQLHAKCLQMCSQWNVLERNENITINHLDDGKETFSSFDRFKIYDKSQTSAIESITYEYNILIQPKGSLKPQPYKIVVRMMSAIAVFSKAENDMPSASIIKFFRSGPLVVEIEYVDYVIARNMMSTIESWMKEIELEKTSKLLTFFQQRSHWLPRIAGTLLFTIALVVSFLASDSVFNGANENVLLAKFLIIFISFISLSYIFGTWIGKIAEGTVDRI